MRGKRHKVIVGDLETALGSKTTFIGVYEEGSPRPKRIFESSAAMGHPQVVRTNSDSVIVLVPAFHENITSDGAVGMYKTPSASKQAILKITLSPGLKSESSWIEVPFLGFPFLAHKEGGFIQTQTFSYSGRDYLVLGPTMIRGWYGDFFVVIDATTGELISHFNVRSPNEPQGIQTEPTAGAIDSWAQTPSGASRINVHRPVAYFPHAKLFTDEGSGRPLVFLSPTEGIENAGTYQWSFPSGSATGPLPPGQWVLVDPLTGQTRMISRTALGQNPFGSD